MARRGAGGLQFVSFEDQSYYDLGSDYVVYGKGTSSAHFIFTDVGAVVTNEGGSRTHQHALTWPEKLAMVRLTEFAFVPISFA